MGDLGDEILAEIRRTLAEELERPGPVEPRHELAADLHLDSVGVVVLAVALEDHFQVKLTGPGAESIVSVRDLVEFVERSIREEEAS